MSLVGRALKKQLRTINRYKQAPILSFKGWGISQIIVFSIYCTLPERDRCTNVTLEKKAIQEHIEIGEYKDIKEFDGYNTPDIEFDHLYTGPLLSRYNRQTKNVTTHPMPENVKKSIKECRKYLTGFGVTFFKNADSSRRCAVSVITQRQNNKRCTTNQKLRV